MLQKAEGATCQATNMLKTLSSLPEGELLLLLMLFLETACVCVTEKAVVKAFF